MKTSLSYCLLIMITISACNNSESQKERESSSLNLAATSEAIASDTCTDSGYQLYLQTALMWQESWRSIYNKDENETGKLGFSMLNVDSLKNMVPTPDAIRLYYCLISSDSIPSLAMVNLLNCTDQYDVSRKSVLISDPVKGQYFEYPDSLVEYASRWKTYSDNQELKVHSPVYAYNYSWEELAKTIDFGTATELFVTFGLRTLSAEEYNEFHYTEASKNQIMGSIVYCNVIYGEDPDNSTQQLFNFARPCPIYCNPS